MGLKINFLGSTTAFPGSVPRTQSSNTPEVLLEDGAKVRDLVRPIVASLVETANEDLFQLGHYTPIVMPKFEMADPKSLKRMQEKARDEYQGSYVDLRDVERGSLDLRRPEHIAAFCTVVDWAKENRVELPHGAVICIAENRFLHPTDTGYSSHKANIVIPIPGEPGRHHIVELMTKHGGFEDYIEENKSHQYYENERTLKGYIMTHSDSYEPAIGKLLLQQSRILLRIHADGRRLCNFNDINFTPFKNQREKVSQEELQAALDFECQRKEI